MAPMDQHVTALQFLESKMIMCEDRQRANTFFSAFCRIFFSDPLIEELIIHVGTIYYDGKKV